MNGTLRPSWTWLISRFRVYFSRVLAPPGLFRKAAAAVPKEASVALTCFRSRKLFPKASDKIPKEKRSELTPLLPPHLLFIGKLFEAAKEFDVLQRRRRRRRRQITRVEVEVRLSNERASERARSISPRTKLDGGWDKLHFQRESRETEREQS